MSDDGKSKIGEQVIHFGEDFLDSIVDVVKGLADSTVDIIKYDALFVKYLYGELSGNELPKWADEYCYNSNEAYEVEVVDEDGYTKAQCTFFSDELESVERIHDVDIE